MVYIYSNASLPFYLYIRIPIIFRNEAGAGPVQQHAPRPSARGHPAPDRHLQVALYTSDNIGVQFTAYSINPLMHGG